MAEAQASVSSREFEEWRCYERLYGPIGPRREDYHAALIALLIAAANHDPKKPAPKLEDFLLFQEAEPPETLMARIAARLPLQAPLGDEPHESDKDII